MNRKYEIDLLVNVARMYYLGGLKQDEIAKKVKVSRSLISLILTEAKELGIVDIKINDPRSNNEELAARFTRAEAASFGGGYSKGCALKSFSYCYGFSNTSNWSCTIEPIPMGGAAHKPPVLQVVVDYLVMLHTTHEYIILHI